jgi:hypothetical protein
MRPAQYHVRGIHGEAGPESRGSARPAHHARHLWPRSCHGNTRHIERRQHPTFHARSRQHGAVARQTWHGRPDYLEINPTAIAWPYVSGPVRSPPSSSARMLLSNWCAIGDIGAGGEGPPSANLPRNQAWVPSSETIHRPRSGPGFPSISSPRYPPGETATSPPNQC